MNTHWLHLNEDIFVWSKNNSILIYNSKNYKRAIIEGTEVLEKIVAKLNDIQNLYCIELNENQLADNTVNEFITQIIKIEGGGLKKINKSEPKPINFFPLLNLQSDSERVRSDEGLSDGEHLYTYLHEMTVHLNGKIDVKNEYYKQITYPVHTSDNLDIKLFEAFFLNCLTTYINKINFVGTNLFSLTGFSDLLLLAKKSNREITFYLYISEISNYTNFIEMLKADNIKIVLVIDVSNIQNETEMLVTGLSFGKKVNAKHSFVITSEDEYEQAIEIIERFNISDHKIEPVFNGNNESFFKDLIYLENDDLQAINLCKREIFARQALNTFAFGKLTIMPDGNVYANVNTGSIGTINNSIKEILYKEMNTNTAWRVIRDKKPCSNCIYQWLCPSPSNYEYVIGKPNLCHINSLI